MLVAAVILVAAFQYALNKPQITSSEAHSTTALSTSSEDSNALQVDSDISQLVLGMQQLGGTAGSGNYSGVLQFYTNSSRLALTGNITSYGGAPYNDKGSYVGIDSIRSIYSYGFHDFVPTPTITVSNLSSRSIGPSTVNATFSLFVSGRTVFWAGANATVSVEQQWVISAGSWVISNETWDFLTTWTQMPGFGEVGPGTSP